MFWTCITSGIDVKLPQNLISAVKYAVLCYLELYLIFSRRCTLWYLIIALFLPKLLQLAVKQMTIYIGKGKGAPYNRPRRPRGCVEV